MPFRFLSAGSILVGAGLSLFPSLGYSDQGFEDWLRSQAKVAESRMLENISPEDGLRGVVIASPSREDPDYYFHWIRDAALVMDVVQTLAEGPVFPIDVSEPGPLFDFLSLSRRNQLTPTLTGLGEPKFFVDGRGYDGPWGRPQNDGPALRAITIIQLAFRLLDEGHGEWVRRNLVNDVDGKPSLIVTDLDYVASIWHQPCFDLWEEVSGLHFYTLKVQQKALLLGAEILGAFGDRVRFRKYIDEADKIGNELKRFTSSGSGKLKTTLDRNGGLDYKTSQLDTAVILAALHGNHPDAEFSPRDSRVLLTGHQLAEQFKRLYSINQRDPSEYPGVAIGRYPEDRYYGGHPWFLTTHAMAELSFEAAWEFSKSGEIRVDEQNIEFWRFIAPEAKDLDKEIVLYERDPRFQVFLDRLRDYGDSFLKRVRKHMANDGSMSEQFHRDTGYMLSAEHLTWSYASFLSAYQARQGLLDD